MIFVHLCILCVYVFIRWWCWVRWLSSMLISTQDNSPRSWEARRSTTTRAGSLTALYVHTNTHKHMYSLNVFPLVRPQTASESCVYTFKSSVGDRGVRPDGEDHGSDSAGVRHRARGHRITKRRRGHHQPAAHTHTEEGHNEGRRCFSVPSVFVSVNSKFF